MGSLPWDMIGVIIGVLSFLLALLLGWEKLGTWQRIIVALVIGATVFFIVNLVMPLLFAPPSGALTPTPLGATTTSQSQSVMALADNFDDSNGSYDKALWECFNDCGSENVLLKDGVLLLLQKGNEGYTSLRSRSKWKYGSLISLRGKMKLSKNSGQGLGWLGINSIANCDINNAGNNFQSPIIVCNSGRSTDGSGEYYTDVVPIQYDRWYQIEISFDHSSDIISFYVENNLIGEHKPILPLDAGQIESAIASNDTIGIEVYMDDVTVITQK